VTLRKERILQIARGSTRSHYVGNSLWKTLWTCSNADCRTNEIRLYVYISVTVGGREMMSLMSLMGHQTRREQNGNSGSKVVLISP